METTSEANGSGLATVGATTVMSTDDAKAEQLRQRLIDCRDRIDSSSFEMAEMLFLVWSELLYTKWKNPADEYYKTFQEYVEQELEFKSRKANYLIRIHDWFGKKLADPVVYDRVKKLGWAKAKELVGVCKLDNAEQWISLAERSSVPQLQEAIKASVNANKEKGEEGAVDAEQAADLPRAARRAQPAECREVLREAPVPADRGGPDARRGGLRGRQRREGAEEHGDVRRTWPASRGSIG